MGYKFFYTIFIMICACGTTSPYDDTEVGDFPVTAVTRFSASADSGLPDNRALIIDSRYNQILEFKIEPLRLHRRWKMPPGLEVKHMFVGPDAAYLLVVGEENYAIMRSDGSYDLNPLRLFGDIRTAAFSKDADRLVLLDSFDNIALIQIDDSGRLGKSWVGGPLLSETGAVSSGVVMPDGEVILALSDARLARVNFDASVSKEKWVYDTFKLEDDLLTDGIEWLGQTGDERYLIAQDSTAVFLIDLSDEKIVAGEILGSPNGHSSGATGHVFGYESEHGAYRVFWGEEGQLSNRLVRLRDSEGRTVYRDVTQSVLNVDADALSVTRTDSDGDQEIYRLRFSDSKIIAINEVKEIGVEEKQAEVAIAEDSLIYLFNNPLGKAERRMIDENQESEVIKGFNLLQAQESF